MDDNEITLQYIKHRKMLLERELLNCIKDFETNTGLEVVSIDWSRNSLVGTPLSNLRSVSVEAMLK